MTKLRGRPSQLLRNPRTRGASLLTAADVTSKAIALLFTPYLANRLGATEFGALSLYLSVTQMLAFAISLGGAGLLAVEFIRNGYTSARRLRAANLRLSLWISLVLLVVSLAVSWLAPGAVSLVSGVLIVAVSYVQALNVLELSYYRGAQVYSVAVVGQFINAGLNVALTVLAFEFDSPTVTNRLLSLALTGGIVQTIYALELRKKHYEPADKATRRANTSLIVRFGLSIFVHQASQLIRASIDRFVVAGFLGLAVAGVYSLGVTLAMVEYFLFASICQQLQPFLYRRLKDRNFSGFHRIQAWYVAAVLCFTAVYYGLLLVSFDLLFDSEFDGAKEVLPALLGGTAVQAIYSIFPLAAVYERRGGQISSVTGVAMLVHVGGLGLLALMGQVTPVHVAVVFFVSNVVAMVGMAWLSRHVVGHLRLAPPELAETNQAEL